MKHSPLARSFLLAGFGLLLLAGAAPAATPEELLAAYTKEAGVAPVPARGQKLFTTNFGKDLGLACSSCHGTEPTGTGKNALSSKPIKPLAPAFNPERFTDRKKVDGWFRDNCKDVVGRECSVGEKADLLAWLMTFKR